MKRAVFRAKIESELISYGYRPGSFIWQTGPARLTLALNGEFRDIAIKATMRKELLAYELGRLKGWAEMLDLKPVENVSQRKSPQKARQIDLEEAIAAA